MRESALYDKVFGNLVGGAIGDAFGIRLEMMHYRDIEAQYGRVTHFDALPPRQPSTRPPLEQFSRFGEPTELEGGFHPLGRWSREVGAYTDDTRYRLIAVQAILRKRGPIDGADLAAEWFNYRLMAEGECYNIRILSWEGI
jgi:ADP-ribosylglycohydrolase